MNSAHPPINQQNAGKRSRAKWIILTPIALALAWLGYDLYGPRSSKLRDFDPNEVARLETDLWRSYYAKERLKLFTQLAELMRSQYHMPLATSNAVAYCLQSTMLLPLRRLPRRWS